MILINGPIEIWTRQPLKIDLPKEGTFEGAKVEP